MNPPPQTTPAKSASRIGHTVRITLIGAAVVLFAIAPFVSSAGDDAVITVVFDADDMGFNATSTKDISNVIVEDCEGETHKHDDLDGLFFEHREDFVIAAVYVKSGSNGIAGNDPPGAGERFVNAGACDETSSSSSSTTSASTTTTAESSTTTAETSTTTAETSTTTAETSTTTVETSTTTAETSTTTAETSTTDDNNTEVPFFTSGTALVLGFGGALAGTLMMLRRRL